MEPSGQEATVCIVATRPPTFELCRDGVYPSPGSYDRTETDATYLALYRTAPVSAITHYARVRNRVEQRRGEPGPMDPDDWAATIEPFSDEEVAVVFELGELVPLEQPIENDQHGVRGARYCTLADLQAATTLSELRTLGNS